MMSLAEATRQFQAQLEAARRAWNDDDAPLEFCEHADLETARARDQMLDAFAAHEIARMRLP